MSQAPFALVLKNALQFRETTHSVLGMPESMLRLVPLVFFPFFPFFFANSEDIPASGGASDAIVVR